MAQARGGLVGSGTGERERLHRLGVATVGELAGVPREALVAALGKSSGELLHALAWGRDERPVEPDRAPKSIGHEETYPTDIVDRQELDRRLVLMADSVASRVRENGMVARTVVLKLRYGDFTTLTRSHTFARPQATGPSFWTAARAMLDGLELRNGARLLGVSASGLFPAESSPGEQLQLDLGSPPVTDVGDEGAHAGAPDDGDGPARASGPIGTERARRWTPCVPASATPPCARPPRSTAEAMVPGAAVGSVREVSPEGSSQLPRDELRCSPFRPTIRVRLGCPALS